MADAAGKLKTAIIVLAILLALNIAALIGIVVTYGWGSSENLPAVAPDNVITQGREARREAAVMYASRGGYSAREMMMPALASEVEAGRIMTAELVAEAGAGNFAVMNMANEAGNEAGIVDEDSAGATKLAIYRRNPDESVPFSVGNMFPGDVETKTYLLQVSHRGTVTVRFHADVQKGSEKLAEVLKCRVELRTTGETLYEGLMRDMPESVDHKLSSVGDATQELVYDIVVFLDTSVGNDYMGKKLAADFRWWVEESGGGDDGGGGDSGDGGGGDDPVGPSDPVKPDVPVLPTDPDVPGMPTDPDVPDVPGVPGDPDVSGGSVEVIDPDVPGEDKPGELIDAPNTGDGSNVVLWAVLAVVSMVMIILLLVRRRKEDKDEQWV